MDPRRIQTQFFSSQNETMLQNLVAQDFQRRTGLRMGQREADRLERTIEHYMSEVWDQNGPMPIQELNKEVITATIGDFSSYLRRAQSQPTQAAAIQQAANIPQRPMFQEDVPQALLEDTGNRFEQIQQERNRLTNAAPRPPEFRISLDDDANAPSALSQFEQAKKAREEDILRAQPKRPEALVPMRELGNPAPSSGDPNGNPTTALPGVTDIQSRLQQDILIKQDSIVNYKETEENLFVYSADRDWVNNTTQNRYNFTVNFDPANNRQGFGMGSAVTKKFKNIVRIELVKVIVPAEGLETLMESTATASSTFSPNTDIVVNTVSFPYTILRVPELDNNNYGTNNALENAFGVLQYDANWNTDNTLADGIGYFALIPKFMKCQKVYSPTPLATLTKLTFQLQRPSGSLLSDVSDSLRIRGVYYSNNSGLSGPTKYNNINTDDQSGGTNSLYLIIRTYEAFSRFSFTKADRVVFGGFDTNQITGNDQAKADLKGFLERPDGHLVVAVGWIDNVTVTDDYNAAGYANYMVIQCPFINVNAVSQVPTGTAPYTPNIKPFGGTAALSSALGTALQGVTFTAGKVLNLSHQTHVVLRVITREMDASMRVRPDNL